jgi:hypothetical protein
MLTRLTDFILGREPVVTATGLAGIITAAFGLLHAFDVLHLTPEQVAAIGTLLAVVAGWWARQAVSPVTSATERKVGRLKQDLAGEDGGVWAAICITFAIVFLLLFGFCVMAGDGEVGEKNSMARTEENRPCEGDCSGKQGSCRDSGDNCSDDDLNGNRVIVCLPESNCSFNKEGQA